MSSKSSIRRNDKPFAGPHGHLLLQLEHHGALAGATRSDDKRSLRQPGRLDSVGNLPQSMPLSEPNSTSVRDLGRPTAQLFTAPQLFTAA